MKIITLALLALLPQLGFAQQNTPSNYQNSETEFPSANEDLVEEHSILNRLFLIYDELSFRLENGLRFPTSALTNAAQIARNFAEDYHEKLEDDYIFPAFQKDERLSGLVKALKAQHDLGRQLTDYILAHANESDLSDETQQMTLADVMRFYVRLFHSHQSRENGILFPAFQRIVPKEEYIKIGKKFDERKNQVFGKDGLQKIVADISKIEAQLGIYQAPRFR